MKFIFRFNEILKFVPLVTLTTLFLIISCGKDQTILSDIDEVMEDEMSEEYANDSDNDVTKDDNEVTSGKIVFEENLSLEESRSVVSFILPANEYDKFLAGEGDLKLVSRQVYKHLNDDFDFVINQSSIK